MNPFKPGPYLVYACQGRDETNQTVLSGITGFHSDLPRAYGPSVARTELRLFSGVVRDVWIPARAGSLADARMPEANGARCVCILVESKLARIKRVGCGVAVLPNVIGIL